MDLQSPRRKRKREKSPSIGEKALQHFGELVVKNGKDYYPCKYCGKNYCGTKTYNLASHLEICQPQKYLEISKKDKDPLIVKRLKLLQHAVQIVTTDGRPFEYLRDEGFQKLIANKLRKLKNAGIPVNMKHSSLSDIKEHLHGMAEKAREKIRECVRNREVSVLIDIATRNNRSIVGISIQFLKEGNLNVFSLGLMELDKAHTGLYLADVCIECLQKYGIPPRKVITITRDNGANVTKMVRDIHNDLQMSQNKSVSEQLLSPVKNNRVIEVNDGVDDDIAHLLAEAEEITDEEGLAQLFENALHQNLLNNMANDLCEKGYEPEYDITGVNCAVHTLQLAIGDALKLLPITHKNMVALIRRIAKLLRLSKSAQQIKEAGIQYKRPRLDVVTRWGSMYQMLLDIANSKPMIEFFAEQGIKEYELLLKKWPVLKEMKYLLNIPYGATISLQKRDLTLSDTYGIWVRMELHLEACSKDKHTFKHTTLAQKLHQSIAGRREKIYSNPYMVCALYLDPRYRQQITTKPEKMADAKQKLRNLWNRIHDGPTNDKNITVVSNTSVESTNSSIEFDFNEQAALENLLTRDRMSILESVDSAVLNQPSDIELLIDLFDPEPITWKDSILAYWENTKTAHPQLYELASVVFAIPPTETQIERDFSKLNYVFNDRRCALQQERLEDIMLLNLNPELFKTVEENELNELEAQIRKKKQQEL